MVGRIAAAHVRQLLLLLLLLLLPLLLLLLPCRRSSALPPLPSLPGHHPALRCSLYVHRCTAMYRPVVPLQCPARLCWRLT